MSKNFQRRLLSEQLFPARLTGGRLPSIVYPLLAAFACLSLNVLVSEAATGPGLDESVVNTPIKDKWALVIGISKFLNSDLNLQYAAKDATDFSNFLVEKCRFARDHVKLLVNEKATASRIMDELGDSWLPRVAVPGDLVVIFISSHGSPSSMDLAGVNYVIAYDTNPDKLFTTGIELQRLANIVKQRVHSDRVLMVLDACHSGAASSQSKDIKRKGNVDAARVAQGAGQLVICSSSKSESSWESKKYQNGVFTRTLIEALQKNGPQTKLGDAFAFLKDQVQKQVIAERGIIQTPVFEASTWKGDSLVLATPPTEHRAAPLEVPEEPSVASTAPSASAVSPVAPSGLQPSASAVSPVAPSGLQQSASAGSQRDVPFGVRQVSGNVPAGVPDISGHWDGTNGQHYNIKQVGRAYSWEMPEYQEYGSGTIDESNRFINGFWWGPITGHGTSTLHYDEQGNVVRMVDDQSGCILTRSGASNKRR